MQPRVLILSLSDSVRSDSSVYNICLPVMLERMGRLVCLRGCTKMPFLPLNKLIFYLFIWGLDCHGAQVIIIILLFQPF